MSLPLYRIARSRSNTKKPLASSDELNSGSDGLMRSATLPTEVYSMESYDSRNKKGESVVDLSKSSSMPNKEKKIKKLLGAIPDKTSEHEEEDDIFNFDKSDGVDIDRVDSGSVFDDLNSFSTKSESNNIGYIVKKTRSAGWTEDHDIVLDHGYISSDTGGSFMDKYAMTLDEKYIFDGNTQYVAADNGYISSDSESNFRSIKDYADHKESVLVEMREREETKSIEDQKKSLDDEIYETKLIMESIDDQKKIETDTISSSESLNRKRAQSEEVEITLEKYESILGGNKDIKKKKKTSIMFALFMCAIILISIILIITLREGSNTNSVYSNLRGNTTTFPSSSYPSMNPSSQTSISSRMPSISLSEESTSLFVSPTDAPVVPATSSPVVVLTTDVPIFTPTDAPVVTQTDAPFSSPTDTPVSPTDAPSYLFEYLAEEYGIETPLSDDPADPMVKALRWSFSKNYVPTKQRFALVVFYFATGGENWKNQFSFLEGMNECLWSERQGGTLKGVICGTDRKVTKLLFADNNLNGTLPNQLASLTNLEALDISENIIRGDISLPGVEITI